MNKTLKKMRLTFVLVIAVLAGIAASHPVKAANLTFTEQFPNTHTAQVIAEKFNMLPTDEISAANIAATTLDVSKKDITDIRGIEIFTNLQSLSLNHNKLVSLPNSIGQLTELKYIYLNSNQLESLPNTFGNLTKAFEINLYNN